MKLPVDLLEQAEIELGGSRATTRMARADMSTTSVQALDGQVHVELRKQMLAMTVLEDVADAFERYMGSNDLLPINYLEKGLRSARSVGLIRYFDTREGKPAVATGFMVSPDLMMTNHHVFPVGDVADFHRFFEDASVEFGNEYDVNGSPRTPICFDLDPNAFFYSWKNLDMALVAVRRTSRGGQRPLADQGYLVLNGELGKAGIGEFATVIQHAEGKPKQIALRNNEIVDLSHPSAVGYASDTAQGSSGAPVFNNEWQVIALHSAGVAKRNASGQLVDKNDQVVEVVNDKVDGSRLVWERNRGIRVSALIAHLRDNETLVSKHPLVLALFHPAYTDRRPLTAVDPREGLNNSPVLGDNSAPRLGR